MLGSGSFDVTSYGAVGDGKTDDSKAFQDAWAALCQSSSSQPTLQIPRGKTFLVGSPVSFEGPCKSPSVSVKWAGTVIGPQKTWKGGDGDSWLEFANVDGLSISGNGKIYGQGAIWWKTCSGALRFRSCNRLRVLGLKSADSPRNHISITNCINATFSNLKLTAPEDSPNTDGIDIANSINIQISNSLMATGDDCIAINDGTSHVKITGLTCGPGHGISVGSLGKEGDEAVVENIYVKNCTFANTDNGARIKTWQGGSGFARKITYEDIQLDNVRNPILIDQYYCPHQTCANKGKAVGISDVWFSNFQGTTVDRSAITLNCSNTVPCTNINLNNIKITAPTNGREEVFAICNNAYGKSSDTVPVVSCLK
ncbi:hypothetical protein CDL15_Pgr015090 [Punica granatum]|nr:hypothetical protein CDL15_Pgr015090 [Punica granatum]